LRPISACPLRRPLTTPPPFPSTPLFRSHQLAVAAVRIRTSARHHTASHGHGRDPAFHWLKAVGWSPPGSVSAHEIAASTAGQSQDQKSTRLNSSHVKNSSAVFCLKKKKR